MRPIIGILSARHPSQMVLDIYRTTAHYLEQVEAAGAVPVQIPLIPGARREDLLAYLNMCDGILFPGGGDFDCSWYGESLLPGLKPSYASIDADCQEAAIMLARMAAASGKPVLGICLGLQVINIALGGSLYQDIPMQIPGALTHDAPVTDLASRWAHAHYVDITPGSLLHSLAGVDQISVNSFHHQAAHRIAPGLKVAAVSPDGVIEALEAENLLAVQWHPENLAHAGDPCAQAIFRWLTDAASRNR